MYFFPDPHGQGSLRPTAGCARGAATGAGAAPCGATGGRDIIDAKTSPIVFWDAPPLSGAAAAEPDDLSLSVTVISSALVRT